MRNASSLHAWSVAIVAAGVVFSSAIIARTEPTSIGTTSAPAAPPDGAKDAKLGIERLSFLSGAWRGSLASDPASKVEELWSEPAGGNMTGAFRWVTPRGKVLIVELLSITQDDAGVKMRLRHFTQSLDEMPKTKAGPLTLTLTSVEGNRAVFAKGATDASADLESVTYDASSGDGTSMTITVAFVQPAADGAKPAQPATPAREPLVLIMKKVQAGVAPAHKAK
jgi:hypothetical protein